VPQEVWRALAPYTTGALPLASASSIPPALDGGQQRRPSWPATTPVPAQPEAVGKSWD